jgi:hypothetical protein
VKKTALLLFVFLLMCHPARAADVYKGCGYSYNSAAPNATMVIFVNGIANSSADACASADVLGAAIGTTNLDLDYFYNKADGFIKDVDELRQQATLSNIAFNNINVTRADLGALTAAQKRAYYVALGGEYIKRANSTDPIEQRIYAITVGLRDKLLLIDKGFSRIVLVPHSQGNFYVEAAYALLVQAGRADVVDKIRVVGVASVAATTPSDTYLSSAGDQQVYNTQWLNTIGLPVYAPLVSRDSLRQNNTDTALSTSGFHSFVKVYLSDLYYSPEKSNTSYRVIVRDYVQQFIAPNVPIINSVTPGNASAGTLTTFTISGTHLPTSALVIGFDGCTNLSYGVATTTRHTFSCTPISGILRLIPRVSALAPALGLYTVVVPAVVAPPAQPAALKVIDAQFYAFNQAKLLPARNSIVAADLKSTAVIDPYFMAYISIGGGGLYPLDGLTIEYDVGRTCNTGWRMSSYPGALDYTDDIVFDGRTIARKPPLSTITFAGPSLPGHYVMQFNKASTGTAYRFTIVSSTTDSVTGTFDYGALVNLAGMDFEFRGLPTSLLDQNCQISNMSIRNSVITLF